MCNHLLEALEQCRNRLGLRLKFSHAQRDALVADASVAGLMQCCA